MGRTTSLLIADIAFAVASVMIALAIWSSTLKARMEDLARCRRLPRENLLAVRWRRVSPRAFIFALADSHRAEILGRLRAMLAVLGARTSTSCAQDSSRASDGA